MESIDNDCTICFQTEMNEGGLSAFWCSPTHRFFSFLVFMTHLISSTQILEFLLGLGIIRVPVRMKLQGQFPVGLFDVLYRGTSRHPQDLVEISPERMGR